MLMPGVDHLRHTHDLATRSFVRGCADTGAELANDLEERIIPLHDASNIAAVIVEPVAGSTGVLVPPRGYLERLRAICDRHGLLLIFDEVITGFGRTGAAFAAQRFGVTPDMITFAKGVTSGTVPLAGVIVRREIYETVVNRAPPDTIELPHGYTYSGHPLATAAAEATLALYHEESLFERARELAPHFEQAVHGLKGAGPVIDIRNFGLMAGIELEPLPGKPGARGYQAFLKCLERGVLIRVTADTIALSPPLIISRAQIDEIAATLGTTLRQI
jgi:beta-alanine--pyruvate transaminase